MTPAWADELDGDVRVHPVYLAGGPFTGDPALQPLVDLPGAVRHHDERGNFFVATSDGRIRVGFIPEQDWDTLWKIAVAPDAFAPPRWVGNFSADTPIEIVAAVTTELVRMYSPDDETWLAERTCDALEWVGPYAAAGWTARNPGWGQLEFLSPDGHASINCRQRPIDSQDAEQAGQDGRFMIGTVHSAGWYGRFSRGTPARILAAASTAMLSPEPVLRYRDALDLYTRRTATITPVTPPAPSPLDVHRALAAKARSTPPIVSAAPPTPAATLAWTTSSTDTATHRR
ncbi:MULTISPECIES: DUF317 domain-containing protein [unclassified Kitasatospora]|uniref:DUF317 domain-containing protein n=1 Tax=unclassified Kitasatospora TaxID=2633591 RepID=UPI00070A6A66|nr:MULTISPECIES: DUF317 domain-containing protein [unclassified Kitasatospora]KQV20960.1 hypothetical protein ASC99_20895 [Kitasatospora sp. Root107]KRB60386.1 hypothetical protein ASE03_12280 [Kitasatospora sp. Root187]